MLIKEENTLSIIAKRPNAPICATAAVLPKIEISHIVICPDKQ